MGADPDHQHGPKAQALERSHPGGSLETAAFERMDGDVAIYVGTDARGLVIELGIVRDDRGEGFAVLHAMPMDWRN